VAQRLTRTHLYNRTGKGSRALPLKASPSRADARHRARRAVSYPVIFGQPCSTRKLLVSSPFHRIRSEHSRVSVAACSGLALLTCGCRNRPNPVTRLRGLQAPKLPVASADKRSTWAQCAQEIRFGKINQFTCRKEQCVCVTNASGPDCTCFGKLIADNWKMNAIVVRHIRPLQPDALAVLNDRESA